MKSNFVKKFGFFFRCLMFTYQVSHAIFIYRVLIPYYFEENSFWDWTLKFLVWMTFPVLVYAHCVTSRTKSFTFKRQKQSVFMNYKEKARYHVCEKCGDEPFWKPFRTKHCSVQKGDVTRFDHFCPVTMNTIGYRNHSAFLKTAALHLLWSMIWFVLYFKYFFNEVLPVKKYDNERIHLFTIIGTVLDNVFMFFVACMSVGVTSSHTLFSLFNITTLDQMSNLNNPAKRTFGNYNFGWLYNFRQFFPNPLWMFWWPMARTSKYEGYYFPQVCVPKESFVVKAMQIDFQHINEKQVRVADKDIINTCKDFYKGKTFKFDGKTVYV